MLTFALASGIPEVRKRSNAASLAQPSDLKLSIDCNWSVTALFVLDVGFNISPDTVNMTPTGCQPPSSVPAATQRVAAAEAANSSSERVDVQELAGDAANSSHKEAEPAVTSAQNYSSTNDEREMRKQFGTIAVLSTAGLAVFIGIALVYCYFSNLVSKSKKHEPELKLKPSRLCRPPTGDGYGSAPQQRHSGSQGVPPSVKALQGASGI